MVRGFESYTEPLTKIEREQTAPTLAALLEWRKGKDMAINNADLRAAMRSKGHHLSDAKVRALINYIRTHGLVERLVANSNGYYVALNATEVADYCDSLREREAAIRAVRQALEGQNTQCLFD